MKFRELIIKFYGLLNIDKILLNRQPRVLFYHGVSDNILNPEIETESISAEDFEKQLKYIIKHFNPISVDEFFERFVDQKWDGREILLTFDDGYRNMLTTGLPILEKYNVPFALFLTTDNITKNTLFPTTINRLLNQGDEQTAYMLKHVTVGEVDKICNDLLASVHEVELNACRTKYASVNPLSWDEAKQIASSSLCTIGSHCVTHICCHERQSLDEIRRQFTESRKEIQDRLNVPCDYLSYPNGNYTPEVTKIAEECGYKMAFSTKYEPVTGDMVDKMAVGRIYVPYDYSRFVYSISRYPRR